jgi:hypothetical protein
MENPPPEFLQLGKEVFNISSLMPIEVSNKTRALDNLTARAFAIILQHNYSMLYRTLGKSPTYHMHQDRISKVCQASCGHITLFSS